MPDPQPRSRGIVGGVKSSLRRILLGLFLGLGGISSIEAAGPPAVRLEVSHTPAQPRSGQPVLVQARIPRALVTGDVLLQIQVVEPGQYLRKSDPNFAKRWQNLVMLTRKPAESAPAAAVDETPVYRALVAATHQNHRSLVRYRLVGGDPDHPTWVWPDPTKGTPNAAWFVYDGIPAWTGASRPGRSAPWTFSPEFLGTLATYHLIARSEDVERSQWDPQFNRQPFEGTLVYDGRVYDHVQFHNRGQGSAYLAGKNKWGFRFPPGQAFAPRDRWGQSLGTSWESFNLNPCASAWAPVNRGMAGLDEALSYRAYELAGVPSPEVFWVHFRVIDQAVENPPDRQYDGDLWGLYLVVEDKNGAWLRRRGLPDGDLFSAESGVKHLVSPLPQASRDQQTFLQQCESTPGEAWWRQHLDLDTYTSFHALNRLLANIDLRTWGNHYLYHPPNGRWVVLPHDLDMMFIPKTHQPGVTEQAACLEVPSIRIEYGNRARELLDLLCTDPRPEGGQFGQLVAEMASFLRPAGHARNWGELDEAMWNWHPRSSEPGKFYKTPFADRRMGGSWTRQLATPDLEGFCTYLRQFCTDARPSHRYRVNDGNPLGYGFGYLAAEAQDDTVPARPRVDFAGAEGFPVNQLAFRVEAYAASNARPFRAVEVRCAEILAPGVPGTASAHPPRYELQARWKSGPLTTVPRVVRIPAGVGTPGSTYRVRARYADTSGRWGHWSEAVEFKAGAATP